METPSSYSTQGQAEIDVSFIYVALRYTESSSLLNIDLKH